VSRVESVLGRGGTSHGFPSSASPMVVPRPRALGTLSDVNERTDDVAVARRWALEIDGAGGAATFLLAASRFRHAAREGAALSLTLVDRFPVGITFGVNAPLEDEWRRILANDAGVERLAAMPLQDRWDFFSRPSAPGPDDVDAPPTDDEVHAFLSAHAPSSGVWPGNPEIVEWLALRDDAGVASLCALVRWESGLVVVASVATRTDARGRGWARRLMALAVARAHRHGSPWVGLGVRHDNEVAQRAYRDVGFTCRARFWVYAAT
jgi:ribosomal protein S18 acetylase RimI-like enzyme